MPSGSSSTAVSADGGFGIYVHWPFCRSKCPYCDFNSHVRDAVDDDRFTRGLLAEIDHYAGLTPGREVGSIFFGGGTPSLMPPATAAAVIERIGRHWRLAPDIEITLEANPNSAEAERFAGFAAAGVNRISLGVQALNDRDLKFLGRRHSAAEALAAVELARRAVPRLSFDLIYARPGQSPADWAAELDRAIGLAGEHLSLYTLTIEAGTPFAQAVRRGDFAPLDPDAVADLYDLTQQRTGAAGLAAYEVSNHARPGAESRHNLVYWRYGDYVGIGAGAHGRLKDGQGFKRATRNWRKPESWLDRVEQGGHGVEETELVDARGRVAEALIMGLRLAEGVDAARFKAETGTELKDALDIDAVGRLARAGLLGYDERGLTASAAGRLVLDGVLREIVAPD